MGTRSHRLLAVVIGFVVFAAMELVVAIVASLVLKASGYTEGADVVLRWVLLLLLFVNIRIGVMAKRRFLRRLESPRTSIDGQP